MTRGIVTPRQPGVKSGRGGEERLRAQEGGVSERRPVEQILQLLEKPALTGMDLLYCSRDPEPLAAIHFRKLGRNARSRRPLDGECVAAKVGDVDLRLECPGVNHFAAALLPRCEPAKFAGEMEAGFFREFALRGGEGVFGVVVFAFRNGPRAGILVAPERTAGMHEKDFEPTGAKPVREDSGALFSLGHGCNDSIVYLALELQRMCGPAIRQ